MISLNWVKDYIDLTGEDLKELAVKVTKAGINVEKVVSNKIDHLTVGEVLEVTPHPDSDHLNVCQVNLGNEVTQIVCGASNVRKGLKVIVALPKAVLPGNFEIKKSKIRGVESNGMICALYELGLEEKTEELYNKGITELDSEVLAGSDPFEVLGLNDTLYELDIHKHRNNDCLYHIGFAYEIGAIINKKVSLPCAFYNEIKEDINDSFTLEVKSDKCNYYLAKMVKDVVIKESPDFIKKRLIAAGMRPINNVVDISNYVMLEYGQPLHFFDKDKLGNKIVVRDALDNEEIVTLDDKQRVLNSNDIVIADGDNAVCIAGVMGGNNTEVDNNTKNILIESAIFDAISVRNTASKLNLRSEASIRYGKGLNYEYTLNAINRACHLLEKYADAKILTGMVSYDNIDKTETVVSFKAVDINKMLGIEIKEDDIKLELEKLDFKYEFDNDVFKCVIPKRRLDIEANVNDIAEEIGRLYGYHNLVSSLPKLSVKKGGYVGDVKIRKLISKRLRLLGLNEAKTYTLTSPQMASLFKGDKENMILPNPMSVDKSVIRTSILPSLLNVYDYNKKRKVTDIFLYEISKTYDVNFEQISKVAVLMSGSYIKNNFNKVDVKVDFYVIKGILEDLLNYLGFKNRYSFEVSAIHSMHPGMSAKVLLDRKEIGFIGRVHPSVHKDDIYVMELNMNELDKDVKAIKYKEFSKYPSIVKDLSFVMDKDISSAVIEDIIKKSASRLLIDLEVFDVYTGENVLENEKSIAYSLTFNDSTKTLNDEDINNLLNKIIKDVESKSSAKLRN